MECRSPAFKRRKEKDKEYKLKEREKEGKGGNERPNGRKRHEK